MTPKQSSRARREPANDPGQTEATFSDNLLARKAAQVEEHQKPPKRGKSKEDA